MLVHFFANSHDVSFEFCTSALCTPVHSFSFDFGIWTCSAVSPTTTWTMMTERKNQKKRNLFPLKTPEQTKNLQILLVNCNSSSKQPHHRLLHAKCIIFGSIFHRHLWVCHDIAAFFFSLFGVGTIFAQIYSVKILNGKIISGMLWENKMRERTFYIFNVNYSLYFTWMLDFIMSEFHR